MTVPYERGLHELGDGLLAYLQPDGGWGWSNAGLVVDGDQSLLVDTLFDLRLTAEMLDAMRRATPAAATIDVVVNTHANGDHCYGNQLVSGAEIVASSRCAGEMHETPPAMLAALMQAAPDAGAVGRYVARIFGAFEFDGIELVPPSKTFEGELEVRVGDVPVRLIEVGPAHTGGDVVVEVPSARTLFTGDILFHGGHPVVWSGPVANWVAACDRILAMDVDTIVPGHGPVTGKQAVADLRDYFVWLTAEAKPRFDAGLPPLDAARDIGAGPYGDWGEAERLVVNITALYRDFGGSPPDDRMTVFAAMADLAGA